MGESVLEHAKWLKKASAALTAKDGQLIDVYELVVEPANDPALSAWAAHFRQQYCLDGMIDALRSGTGKSRAEYLRDLVFPSLGQGFGPATRSGDFAEILVADLLEFVLGYWVPRVRYAAKMVRNESVKGTDVIGFKTIGSDPTEHSVDDSLITFETKAQLSGNKPEARLQDAIKDAAKDVFRLAESLNALKRRLIDQQLLTDAKRVERFQDALDRPYLRKSGAAAVFCDSVFDPAHIASSVDCSNLKHEGELVLIVVHSQALMVLANSLYDRAADGA